MSAGRQATLAVWLAGLAVLIGLTVWSGASHVGDAIVKTGWAALWVVVIRAAAIAVAGGGWWLLFPREIRPSALLCVALRCVREGGNALLPLAQIGGDFIGARCLALRGVGGTVAAASVIVDVLMQAATQLVFALIGLVLLIAIGGNELIVWPVAFGIALALPLLGGVLLLQGERGQRLMKFLLTTAVGDRGWMAFGTIDELFARLDAFYSHHRGLLQGLLWHLGGWFVGALEVWVVLKFMGFSIDFGDAVLIESLMHAARGAAFAIPGALGAQEGSLIVLCAIFGVRPEAALALSLVKRLPDLVLGVPGLMAWQAMEGWHFHGRSPTNDQNGRA